MTKHIDYMFKLLLLGNSGVGKSSILFRFSELACDSTCISTIGIDFKMRTIELDGKKIKLQVWIPAGQECLFSKTTEYYSGVVGIMLVYDITDEKSFGTIKNWNRDTEEKAPANVEKILLGNKCDLLEKRQIDDFRVQISQKLYGIEKN